MAKDPAVLFYTSDFLVGTMLFSDAQVGKYMRLLCLQHQQGHLQKSEILDIMHGEIDEKVLAKFVVDKDGLYYNERMELEAEKRRSYCKSRSDNRMSKVSEIQDKHMSNICQTYDQRMENEDEDVNDNIDSNKATLSESRFTEFWSLYPKKVGKKAAYAAWKRIKVTSELHNKMLDTIRLQKTGAQWQKDNGQYIPNPATWLNQGRWDDEVPAEIERNPFIQIAKDLEAQGL